MEEFSTWTRNNKIAFGAGLALVILAEGSIWRNIKWIFITPEVPKARPLRSQLQQSMSASSSPTNDDSASQHVSPPGVTSAAGEEVAAPQAFNAQTPDKH